MNSYRSVSLLYFQSFGTFLGNEKGSAGCQYSTKPPSSAEITVSYLSLYYTKFIINVLFLLDKGWERTHCHNMNGKTMYRGNCFQRRITSSAVVESYCARSCICAKLRLIFLLMKELEFSYTASKACACPRLCTQQHECGLNPSFMILIISAETCKVHTSVRTREKKRLTEINHIKHFGSHIFRGRRKQLTIRTCGNRSYRCQVSTIVLDKLYARFFLFPKL